MASGEDRVSKYVLILLSTPAPAYCRFVLLSIYHFRFVVVKGLFVSVHSVLVIALSTSLHRLDTLAVLVV